MHKPTLALTRIAVIAAVSSILLSGCGAPPVGEVAPPRSPVGSDFLHLQLRRLTFPELIVPTSCQQLAPIDLVQSALAVPAELISREVSPEFRNYFPLPEGHFYQAGGLSCAWYLASEVDGNLGILIEVLPGAAAEWAAALPALTQVDDNAKEFGVLSNTFGDSSSSNCFAYEEGEHFYGNCYYNILVGEYWVYVHIKGQGRYGADEPTRIHELEILHRIPSLLDNVPSLEQTWRVPPTAFAPRNCVGLVGLDVMRTAAGDPTLVDNFSVPALQYDPFQQAASNLAGALRCNWRSAAPDAYLTADVVVLPGGAWSWDGIATPDSEIPHEWGIPVTINGVGDAARAGVCETPPRTLLRTLMCSSTKVGS